MAPVWTSSMRKPRDTKAEYARRKRNGLARGLSLSQARGHPKAGEVRARGGQGSPALDPVLETGLRQLRAGKSLSQVARELHVGRERLSAYAKDQAGATRKGVAWSFDDQRRRRIRFFANGEHEVRWVKGFEPAALAGHYHNDARALLADLDELDSRLPDFVAKYAGKSIRDTSGREYFLEVDPNEIYRLAHAYPEPYEQIYQLVAREDG